LALVFQLLLQNCEFMRPADDNLQFRQDRRLADVVVDTPLNQIHGRCLAVVIRHHDHGDAEIADFVEEFELLLNRVRTGIQVEDEDIALPLRNEFPDAVPATFEESGEPAAQGRRKEGCQIDVFRM
jgi:hypothetical protein